jgi:hypothetical protein
MIEQISCLIEAVLQQYNAYAGHEKSPVVQGIAGVTHG